MRWLLLSLPLALSACAGGEVTDAQASPDVQLPDAPGTRVEVATLGLVDVDLALELPAELQGEADANLASPTGGFVDAVLVKPGDAVRQGQVLARVDYATSAHRLEIAEAQAQQADAELERAKRLGEGISKSALLSAETQSKVANANLEMARINASRAAVRAPFSGRVAEVFVEKGEVAGPGAPVARLVQSDPVIAELSVSDRDIVHLRDGQEVTLRVQSVPQPFTGTVRTRGVAADAKTRTWTVEVEVPNPDEVLMPGMLGRVSFERRVAEQAIAIPQDWVVTRIDNSGVYVNADGRAEWRDVTLGAFVKDQVVVSEGLSEGESIIITGHRGLAPGDPLIVVREGRCCEAGRVTW